MGKEPKISQQTNLIDAIEEQSRRGVTSHPGGSAPHGLTDFRSTRVYIQPIDDWGPSLTRQEFAEECDINTIMRTYERTGVLPPPAGGTPQYLDVTDIPQDYQTALNMMAAATSAFEALPAQVRKEFDNDPVQFVEFASDPENLPQMQTWGLAPTPAPAAAPAAPEAPPPKPAT